MAERILGQKIRYFCTEKKNAAVKYFQGSFNRESGSSELVIYEGRTESQEQHFLHANWEQQTKESMVLDGTSCCVILECLVTSIACIT